MATLSELTDRAQARRELPAPSTRRALRNAVGASLDDVASVVGVTRQAVSMWELGQRAPSTTNLERYLEVIRAFKQVVAAGTGGDAIENGGSRARKPGRN